MPEFPTTYAVGDRVVFRPEIQKSDRRMRGRVGTVVKDGRNVPVYDSLSHLPGYEKHLLYAGLYLVDWEDLGEYWEIPNYIQPEGWAA